MPLRAPQEGVKEVRRAKALGASAITITGTAGDILLHDRRFDPVWAEIQDQGMPLCIHVGWTHDGIGASCDSPAAGFILNFELGIVFGLFSFLAGGILDRFPRLRIAFIEGGADWFPTAVGRMEKWRKTPTAEVWPAEKGPMEYLREREIYFTVEGDEDTLVDFVNFVGVNRILGAADFPHVHYEGGKLGEAFGDIREREDISDSDKDLIFGANALNFYGYKVEDLYFARE